MIKLLKYLLIILVIIISYVGYKLFWPPAHTPGPYSFVCIPEDKGRFVPLIIDVDNIYGVALTYPCIIEQIGAEYDPDIAPPVFRKLKTAINFSNTVVYPDQQTMWNTIKEIEPDLYDKIDIRLKTLPILMDYEVELGIVILHDITKKQLSDKSFYPRIGYFLANDMQSIAIAILGLDTEFESSYFDAKGSFPGFLILGSRMWIPGKEKVNSNLCIELKTIVNGEIRQRQNTKSRIYSNKEILMFILNNYNKEKLTKGTAVITGSPAGVANQTPRWKRRLAKMFSINRFQKLLSVKSNRFLKPGDVLVIDGGPLGEITTKIVAQ